MNHIQTDKEVAQELFNLLKKDTEKLTETTEPSMLVSTSGVKLMSQSTFEAMELKPEMLKSLVLNHFERPSLIQGSTIPYIVQGRDIVVQSKSGTGKTIAFSTGVLNSVIPGQGPQAVIVTPTRELSIQVSGVINRLAKHLNISVYTALRSRSHEKFNSEIIIGSPGTLLNLTRDKLLDPAVVRKVVFDEADILLNKDMMGAQSFRLIKLFQSSQKIFFSATYSAEIKEIILAYTANLVTIYEKENSKPDEIKLYFIEIRRKDKLNVLHKLYEHLTIGQSIIFVQTKAMVERLRDKLSEELFACAYLHGDMEIEERGRQVELFKNAEKRVLIATDVFSRGMDIPQVNLIINYDLPIFRGVANMETYIHRIGRSGRFGRTGFVVDFISDYDELEVYLKFQSSLKFASKKFSVEALEEVVLEEL